MKESEVLDYARQLLESHGAMAIAEAAQQACRSERQGEGEEARTWRRIEEALKLMCGANAS
jgi:hypothetical protein